MGNPATGNSEDTVSTSAVKRHEDILIPVQSDEVAATRYEPTGHDSSLPAILIATPYRKDDRITFGLWDPDIQYLARHGYNVVAIDLVGSGASSGRHEPWGAKIGGELAAVIDWLSNREWCSGEVGMYGLSYGAYNQWAAAAEQPEALKAIVPVAATPQPYTSSFTGGAFNPLKRASWASKQAAMAILPPSRRDREGRWAEVWKQRLDDLDGQTPWLFKFRENDVRNEFWRSREIQPGEIRVPILMVCGTKDVHTLPLVDFFAEIDAQKRLMLGPWRHRMPQQGKESSIDFRRQAVEWFDHFLKGIDNDALNHSTVEYWTERDGGWSQAGIWRESDYWPTNENSDSLSFAVSPEGLVRSESFDDGEVKREYTFDQTVGMETHHRILGFENPGIDTNPDDVRSLLYETGELSDPVEYTGNGTATIRIRAQTEDALVNVRVTDVDPNGHSKLVTSGYLKASHRDGHENPSELTPGEEYEISIPLHPKSHVFEKDHRIRVSIGAANFPRALPPNEQGAFTVVSTPERPSGIEFPGKIHHGEVAFADDTSMEGPDDGTVPVGSTYTYGGESKVEATRDHVNNTATFTAVSGGSIELPHNCDMTVDERIEASVTANDPGTFYMRHDTDAVLEYDDEIVEVTATSRITQDYTILAARAAIDGQPMYENSWRM